MTRGFTNLTPGHLDNNQTFQQLSHFMIIRYKIILFESIQKIVHATTFDSVSQKHQSVVSTTLTENRLQTLSTMHLVLEMTTQPLFERVRGSIHF